jgi:hypothetical protein
MDATEGAGTGSELDALPRIDEHSAVIDRGIQATWASLLHVVEASFSSRLGPRFTRALGCADTSAGGPRPLVPGSTLPGFQVAEVSAPHKLVLLGSHRYSRYALSFALEDLDEDRRTRLRAETRAEFPGVKGTIYKSLVIGSRIHVLVTRRILVAVDRRASRA